MYCHDCGSMMQGDYCPHCGGQPARGYQGRQRTTGKSILMLVGAILAGVGFILHSLFYILDFEPVIAFAGYLLIGIGIILAGIGLFFHMKNN